MKDTAVKTKPLISKENAQNRPETIQRETVLRFWAFLRFGSKSAIRQRKGGVCYAKYAEIPQERMGVLS